MKQFILKSITILTVPIIFTCFLLVLGVGFAVLATCAVVRFIYNLLEK